MISYWDIFLLNLETSMSKLDLSRLPSRIALLIESTPNGAAIFEFLSQTETVQGMMEASDRGLPAAGAVSRPLYTLFGDAVRVDNIKRAIGLFIGYLLGERHYEVDRQGIKLRDDPVFSTASRFRRRIVAQFNDGRRANPDPIEDFIERLLEGLSLQQLDFVAAAAHRQAEAKRRQLSTIE